MDELKKQIKKIHDDKLAPEFLKKYKEVIKKL